jgi:hypothetical protein
MRATMRAPPTATLPRRQEVDIRAVSPGLKQRKPQCVLAGEEETSDQTVAVAGGPVAVTVVLDVEMMGRANALWGKIGHLG